MLIPLVSIGCTKSVETMSSRAGSEAARLRRLKRLAGRHGLAVLVASKPSSKVPGGGYMLTEDASRKVLLGDQPLPYSASLDQIEEHLDNALGIADDAE